MRDTLKEITDDVLAVGRIDAVPVLLQVICETTGMGFAAVSRVLDGRWTACAVRDSIKVGLKPGAELDVRKTLCREVMESRRPVVISHASVDPDFRDYQAPKLLGVQSYISVPIVLCDGEYFGNLCAANREPLPVSDPRILLMFTRFAGLIARQLEVKKVRARERAAAVGEFVIGERRELIVAMLGHDLRGPLESITAEARQLEERTWDSKSLEAGLRIQGAVRRMSAVVDDILDYARGRLGEGIAVKRRAVEDMETIFDGVVRHLRAVEPRRTLIANVAVARSVHCDPDRLRQLVVSLLNHAFTAGPELGPVSLVAQAEGTQLTIEVWHDGEPIPAAELSRVFTPFWQDGNGGGRGDSGDAGLGLYLCARIVEAHGGAIAVRSEAGQGTQYSVHLPLDAR